MNNLFFKSANGLSKKLTNTPVGDLILKLEIIQTQNRALRQDLVDLKLMINRLLVDKHLQMQVDNYFDDNPPTDPPEDISTDRE